jgi:exonuclease III
MRLLAWNIRQGGGSRLARIADALAHHEADILVLSEYRGGEAAARSRATLKVLGYRHATAFGTPAKPQRRADRRPLRVLRSR